MELLVDVEKFPSVNGMEIVLSISSLVYVDQQKCLYLLGWTWFFMFSLKTLQIEKKITVRMIFWLYPFHIIA